jgi:7,8-dihydropterin-6-yl-methyl-4-(beta-D-ribofuranosyl)aminobenzene 5'-phosphate synthase
VKELGLLLDTQGGPVLLTGCAHPGVVQMVESATSLAGKPLLAVLGGFHLYQKSGSQVDAVIAQLKDLGVKQCGPSHCTGSAAIARFEKAFGSDFIEMGVGAVVQF